LGSAKAFHLNGEIELSKKLIWTNMKFIRPISLFGGSTLTPNLISQSGLQQQFAPLNSTPHR